MSDPERGAHVDTPGMEFAEWLSREIAEAAGSERAGATWLARQAVDPDTGEPVMSVPSAHELLTAPRKGLLSIRSIRAIAAMLKRPQSHVYVPNLVAIGLDPPDLGDVSAFGATIPRWADQLPIGDQTAIRDLILRLGKAHGLTD